MKDKIKSKNIFVITLIICSLLLLISGCTWKTSFVLDPENVITEYYGFEYGEDKPVIIPDKPYLNGADSIKVISGNNGYIVPSGTWYKEELLPFDGILSTDLCTAEMTDANASSDKVYAADHFEELTDDEKEKVRQAVAEEVKKLTTSGEVLYKGSVIDNVDIMADSNGKRAFKVRARAFIIGMTEKGPKETVTAINIDISSFEKASKTSETITTLIIEYGKKSSGWKYLQKEQTVRETIVPKPYPPKDPTPTPVPRPTVKLPEIKIYDPVKEMRQKMSDLDPRSKIPSTDPWEIMQNNRRSDGWGAW